MPSSPVRPANPSTRPAGTAPGALGAAILGLGISAVFAAILVSAVGFEGFVAAGNVYSADASIFVNDHIGYDGQFFYRLAIEPFSTAAEVDGVSFDAPAYRQQRIGYPLLAHLTAALTPLSVVQALVVVNVAASGVLVFFMARIAQSYQRSPLLGVLILAWPAFTFSLGLDLAEIVAAAFVTGALRYALIGKHALAAAFLVGAALTRETTVLIAVVALVVYRRTIYTAVIAVLAGWQLVVWSMWSEIPGVTSLPAPGERVVGLPFVGFVDGVQRWGIIDVAVFAALVTLGYLGVRHIRSDLFPAVALLGYGVLLCCLGWPVWESWRGFSRAAVEFVIAAFVLRLGAGMRRSGWPVAGGPRIARGSP